MVVNSVTKEPVHGAFVLKPFSDKHARAAVLAYAESIKQDNSELALDLERWISTIESFME
jgi:hypothetical protein